VQRRYELEDYELYTLRDELHLPTVMLYNSKELSDKFILCNPQINVEED